MTRAVVGTVEGGDQAGGRDQVRPDHPQLAHHLHQGQAELGPAGVVHDGHVQHADVQGSRQVLMMNLLHDMIKL